MCLRFRIKELGRTTGNISTARVRRDRLGSIRGGDQWDREGKTKGRVVVMGCTSRKEDLIRAFRPGIG